MNKEALEIFVNQIEKLSKINDKEDYVKDNSGIYLKSSFLENLVLDAKELIKYGEYEIALENILENLNEVSIVLDEKVVNLARQAFGEKITTYTEILLSSLTKK